MILLFVITLFCVLLSFYFNREKTFAGLRKGLKMFLNLLPVILVLLIAISGILYLFPDKLIVRYLGEGAGALGFFIAAIMGSIALIPGFIAFPLAGILVKSGVSYSVIAVFITTLMMVGVLTLPLEARYFGLKTAIIRNCLFFIGALIIGLIIGIII
ncbi:MAG: hypothetical protein U0T82_18215 [Bacteroidales bacterium]